MPPEPHPEGQKAPPAAPLARRASRAPRLLTAEDVLAAVGCSSYGSLVHAALPSRGVAALSPQLTALLNLADLDLSGNVLQDLSPLAALPSLRRLNAAGNCLVLPWAAPDASAGGGGSSTHTPAAWFASLESLDLSYNQLRPEALLLLQHLPRLRELDITGNALLSVPAVDRGAFPVLHRLAAGHNQLPGSALATLSGLPLLQQLVLQHNHVGELPSLPPAAFARLELLDLSFNRLADLAAVQRLLRLPSIQRLVLVGCPAARAGFGAAGTIAGTMHQAQGGMGRSGVSRLAGDGRGSRAGKPTLAQTFQFSAVVEEASAVSLRAKRLARRGSAASSAGGTASMHSSATTSACPTRPGTSGCVEEGAGPAGGAQQVQAASAAGAEGGGAATAAPLIDWEESRASSEEEEELDGWQAHCAGWSTGSTNGSCSTAGEAWLQDTGLPLAEDDDPTTGLALALGLDLQLLPAFGGPGVAGNPCAAIKALRFALAHPSSTPSLSAGPASGGDHHLALTASVRAKQQRKAGEGSQLTGGPAASQRVQQIDELLAAVRRRLRAVQAAMAADAAQVQAAEGQREEQRLGAIAEDAGSARLAGEVQPAPTGEDEVVVGSQPVPGSQPILVLSNSGKHTQAHNLLVNVLAGLPAEANRPSSSGPQHPASSAVTSRSGAGQGSPRLKRPSVVAAELHALADALREQQ